MHQIDTAQRQAHEIGAGGDLGCPRQALGTLHRGDQRHATNAFGDPFELGGGLDLWYPDAAGERPDRGQVVVALISTGAVDPYPDPPTVFGPAQGIRDMATRLVAVLRRNRVLQVEDDRVGIGVQRLDHQRRLVTGYEEVATCDHRTPSARSRASSSSLMSSSS